MLLPGLHTFDELLDRLRLVTGRPELGRDLERGHGQSV
jgi:hypothetical protein